MKTTIITEFVNFKVLETTSTEQLLVKADNMIDGFLRQQEGFMDGELVKNAQENACSFILRYDSMEKVKAIVDKMRSCKEFDEFKSVIVPGSISVSFNQMIRKW
jgi:hypothetical protein